MARVIALNQKSTWSACRLPHALMQCSYPLHRDVPFSLFGKMYSCYHRFHVPRTILAYIEISGSDIRREMPALRASLSAFREAKRHNTIRRA